MMKRLFTNPYSFDAYQIKKDSQGRAVIPAKIMKVGRLKYTTKDGKVFFGNITEEELQKAANTAKIKPVTIRHPPDMLKPSDVMKYQEGISADGFEIKDFEDGKWLTGPLVLQSDKAIQTAEDGETGVSAGYVREAVPTDEDGVFDFKEIDINHIAIGCSNPRAEGAGLSLDEAEDDSARIYSFAKQPKTKKHEVIMKEKLNAVKVGDLSMDETQIVYDEAGEGTQSAIAILTGREEKLVGHVEKMQVSMDDAEEAHKTDIGQLTGENKALKAKNEDLEKEREGMVSLDDVDKIAEERADVKEEISIRGIDKNFKTILEGKRIVVENDFPDQSFDDAEIDGAYKTRNTDKKLIDERQKSKSALKTQSLDSGDKMSLSQIDADELIKRKKEKR